MTTASGNMNIDDLSETNGLTALLGVEDLKWNRAEEKRAKLGARLHDRLIGGNLTSTN